MSYDALERSTFEGEPWEALWFSSVLQNFRYTSGDEPRIIGGQVFTPEAVICSEPEQNDELGSGSLTVQIPVDCALADLFRGYLPPRPVSLVIYRGHDGEVEIVSPYQGVVASSERDKGICTLSILPEQEDLRRQLPSARFQRQCLRRLGSARCGVNLNDYLVLATLDSVSGRTVRSSAFASKPDGYFRAGWLDALGTSMSIANHVGDALTLFFPLPGLAAGMQVVTFPGCQGTESECATKFNNLVNHLGFARIPGVNPFGEGGIK